MSYDFEKDAEEMIEQITNSEGEIAQELQRLDQINANIAELESLLESAKKQKDHVEQKIIPDLFDKYGVKAYTLKDGTKVEVKDEVTASISAENKPLAYSWLRKNDFDDLIKNEIIITFNKGEDDSARQLIQDLMARGLTPEQKENIHWQTLHAFVKEQLAAGTELPIELFGVYQYKKAKVKKGK